MSIKRTQRIIEKTSIGFDSTEAATENDTLGLFTQACGIKIILLIFLFPIY